MCSTEPLIIESLDASFLLQTFMWLVVLYSIIMQANHFVFYNKNHTHCNLILVTIIAVSKLELQ